MINMQIIITMHYYHNPHICNHIVVVVFIIVNPWDSIKDTEEFFRPEIWKM